MDPLTHSLLGLAMARTPLRRTTGLSTAALVLGANLPDVDVASFVAGSDGALGFRRGLSHGPLGLLLLPSLLALLIGIYDQWRRSTAPDRRELHPRNLLALCYLGCLTHPLLDWMNTYGIRWLMPFDEHWYYGDTLFIIDPWLWLILGATALLGSPEPIRRGPWLLLAVVCSAGVIVARDRMPAFAIPLFLSGLGTTVGLYLWKPLRKKPETIARAGLLCAVAYIAAMSASTVVAEKQVSHAMMQRGVDVTRMMVGPNAADPFVRDVVVETANSYQRGAFRWLASPRLTFEAQAIPRPEQTPVIEAARRAPSIQGFLGWARFPYVEVTKTSHGHTVLWIDARYERFGAGDFGTATVKLDHQLQPLPD